jgi:hypothetical protein
MCTFRGLFESTLSSTLLGVRPTEYSPSIDCISACDLLGAGIEE